MVTMSPESTLINFVEVDPLIADVEALPQWMEWLGQSTTLKPGGVKEGELLLFLLPLLKPQSPTIAPLEGLSNFKVPTALEDLPVAK